MPIGYSLYLEEIYGITAEHAAAAPAEVQLVAMKALLVVAGADGLSTSEHAYFLEWQKACGAPESTIAALREFDYARADPKQVIVEFVDTIKRLYDASVIPAMARSMIYDAIRIAWVDGYSNAERSTLHKMAEVAGIDKRTVAALERQVELEIILRANRLALLHEGG